MAGLCDTLGLRPDVLQNSTEHTRRSATGTRAGPGRIPAGGAGAADSRSDSRCPHERQNGFPVVTGSPRRVLPPQRGAAVRAEPLAVPRDTPHRGHVTTRHLYPRPGTFSYTTAPGLRSSSRPVTRSEPGNLHATASAVGAPATRAESAFWSISRRPAAPRRSAAGGIALPGRTAYGGFPLNRWDRNWPSLPRSSPAGRCPMTTAAPSTALATIQPAFTDPERLALAVSWPGTAA